MTLLAGCGISLALLLIVAARLLATAPALVLPVVLAGFAPYLIAVRCAPRLDWRRVRWLVLIVAVLVRLGFLAAPIVLSDDAHRYLWEGKIQNAGFNPYRYAPAAPELTGLRDANWQQVAHREVSTIYPPLLLLVFRVVAGATGGSSAAITSFKAVFTAFDLATIGILVRLLRARGQNQSLALIWAWNPLVVIEFAGSGHEMSLAICLFATGLWLLTPQRSTFNGQLSTPSATRMAAAGALFGAAIMAHLMAAPLVVAVVLARRVSNARFWGALAMMVAGSLALFAGAGSDLLLGPVHFASRWRFNGSLFELLVRLFDGESPHQVFGGVWMVYERPKQIVALAVIGVMLWTWWRRDDAPRAALAVGGALLLFSPVVHPWYVTWLVALTALEVRVVWLAWSALVLLAYGPRLGAGTPGLVPWLEYLPLSVILAAEWWWRRHWGRHPCRSGPAADAVDGVPPNDPARLAGESGRTNRR